MSDARPDPEDAPQDGASASPKDPEPKPAAEEDGSPTLIDPKNPVRSPPASEARPAKRAAKSPPKTSDSGHHRRAAAVLSDRGPEVLATSFFFVLFVVSIGSIVYLFAAYLTDIILAAVLSALALPVHRGLTPRVGDRAWLSAILTTGLVVFVLAVPTTFLVTSLSVEAGHAIQVTQESFSLKWAQDFFFGDGVLATYLKRGASLVGIEYTPESVKSTIAAVAGAVAQFVYKQANTILGNVLAGLLHFTLIVLMLFYLLLDGHHAKRFLFRLSPLPDEEEELLAQKFNDVGRAILFGNGMGSVLQGVIGGIAMVVAGLPSPVLWGTVMSIFAFLPLVGISVVVIPASAYLAIQGQWVAALVFFVFCMAEAALIENVVKTKMIGSRMKMHNMVIFMAIIGGLSSFGVLGLLYGPLIVAFFLTLAELYHSRYQFKFMTAAETAAAETVMVKNPPSRSS